MINWKEISELHVIKKLEQIVGKWFGVDLIYADEHHNIHGQFADRKIEFQSHFSKVQMNLNYGTQYLHQDIEKINDEFKESPEASKVFESFFEGVKGIAAPIVVDGEYLGCAIAYPFTSGQMTSEEAETLKKKLIECGSDDGDANQAIESLSNLSVSEKEYLQELIELVAQEVVTFHEEISKREERILELNSELGSKFRYHNLIGKSKKMQMIYRLLEKISNSESTCLIQGENGTGKELVAKAIHYNSPRKDRVFIAQNCSAFNDNLLDSELFGHVKGAFTGAVKDKKGLFEMSHGGTLFLDEVGDTSMSMQVKLLRVLQEGTFLPVGSTQPKKVDVRVIAATNRNLKEMIKNGEFREDLYYRINVINIALPALRERGDDVQILAEHFLETKCAETGIPTKTLSKKTLEKMYDYHWPGNVRELQNEIERMVVLAGDDKNLTPDLLSPRITEKGRESGRVSGFNPSGSLKDALEEVEKIMIREGLKRCEFNKSRLAKELGISRASLITKVDKYGLDKRKKTA